MPLLMIHKCVVFLLIAAADEHLSSPLLTERCQVAVLRAEQEQVNRHLLPGAVQS